MRLPDKLSDEQRELLGKHVGLPRIFAKKYQHLYYSLDFDELEAEATVGLLRAASTWDSGKRRSGDDMRFPLFAWGRMRDAARDAVRVKGRRNLRFSPTDPDTLDQKHVRCVDDEAATTKIDEMRRILDHVISGQLRSERTRQIVRERLKDRDVRDVAEEFGCTYQYVSKLMTIVGSTCRRIAHRNGL